MVSMTSSQRGSVSVATIGPRPEARSRRSSRSERGTRWPRARRRPISPLRPGANARGHARHGLVDANLGAVDQRRVRRLTQRRDRARRVLLVSPWHVFEGLLERHAASPSRRARRIGGGPAPRAAPSGRTSRRRRGRPRCRCRAPRARRRRRARLAAACRAARRAPPCARRRCSRPCPMSGARMASVTSAPSRRTRTPALRDRGRTPAPSARRASARASPTPRRVASRSGALGGERHRAVHGPRVDEDEAEHVGQAPGDGALACAGRAVDGDDGRVRSRGRL